MTRPAVAAALGVHVSTVRRLETRGVLRPTSHDGRWPLYRLEDVAAVIKQPQGAGISAPRSPITEGQITARAFELFRRGLSHEQVVIALEQPAATIRKLFDQWRAGYRQPARAQPTDDDDTVDPAITEREVRDWEKAMTDLMQADSENDTREAADQTVGRYQRRDRRAQQIVRSKT